jgi:hypothetical protein
MSKLFLFLLFLCGNVQIQSAQVSFYNRIIPSAKDVCIVSLGGNCRNSTWLKELNIRFEAYPFDWVESEEIEGVIDLINNDFEDYLSLKNLIPHHHSHYNRVRDTQYKINLVHEFSFQGTANFSFANEKDLKRGMSCLHNEYRALYEKYNRRITRFRNLTQNYKTIIFMRTLFVDKPSAICLYEALIKLFGTHYNIILVVVNDTEEFKQDWGYPKIKNFYLPTSYLIHDGYGQSFGQIIETVLAPN